MRVSVAVLESPRMYSSTNFAATIDRRNADGVRRSHLDAVEEAHEELGQRLAAISLAAGSLEKGGDVAAAVALIRLAVGEARHELKLLRYETRELAAED